MNNAGSRPCCPVRFWVLDSWPKTGWVKPVGQAWACFVVQSLNGSGSDLGFAKFSFEDSSAQLGPETEGLLLTGQA